MFRPLCVAIFFTLLLNMSSNAQVTKVLAKPTKLIIKTNGYAGNYAVNDESRTAALKYVSGDTVINVYARTPYSIINGANIGHPGQPFNGAIWFYVADDRTVSGLEPQCSAKLHDSVIELQTSQVNIDPGAFTGQYLINIFENTAYHIPIGLKAGNQIITVIKGLSYYIKTSGECHCGSLNLQNNYIYFNVDEDGKVYSLNPKAISASGSTISFNTKVFRIDSSEGLCKRSGALYVNGYNKEPIIKPLINKDDMINIICNIATCIHAKDWDGVKCQCFFPK